MRWLTVDQENLVRRMRTGPGASFDKSDTDALNVLVDRGLVTESKKWCPNCGLHMVRAVQFTERGKIACLILDYLYRKPVM